MTTDRQTNRDHTPAITKSTHDYRTLFVVEGAILIILGLLAIVVPSIITSRVSIALGWLFLGSGTVGLATTLWIRHAPGFWWSLVSALLAILVGIVLITSESHELYGGLLGWPFETPGPLRMILLLFFLIEGGSSIMLAIEHRYQFSGRWAWMFASGVIDIVLASIIIFDLPGSSAWTMGLLVGINMILGGSALIAMGLHTPVERAGSNAPPLRKT